MKHFLVLSLAIIAPIYTYSQFIEDPLDRGVLYLYTDKMPSFTGGNNKLQEYLRDNIQMPSEFCGDGRVIVSFVVSKDGSIRNTRVVRKLEEFTDKEAIRLVEAMPKWEPGMLKGKNVDVLMYLPIYFVWQ